MELCSLSMVVEAAVTGILIYNAALMMKKGDGYGVSDEAPPRRV